MSLMSFEDVLGSLSSYTNYERVKDYAPGTGSLGTQRIESLLELAGNPQLSAPVIHIAGSKGKGSTAHLTANILAASGLHVGLYTSPHLSSICERIQVGLAPISEDFFCECFEELLPFIKRMDENPDIEAPTYFEIITAVGMLAFSKSACDVYVLEVGLGGRLDATNVFSLPVVCSCITTVSKDHTALLGEDLISIAGEKAGIMRRDVPVVIGPQEKSVLEFLKDKASMLGCPTRIFGEDITVELRQPLPVDVPEAPQQLDFKTWRGRYFDIALPLLGTHQRSNAALALALADQFFQSMEMQAVEGGDLQTAWSHLNIPARLEIVSRQPWMLIDGAHNPASFWALSVAVSERFSTTDRVFVFGAAADKNIMLMLKIIAPLAKAIVFTGINNPRCMDVLQVSKEASENFPEVDIFTEEDLKPALGLAISLAGKNGLVCVCGSLYLAGAAREELGCQ